MNTWNGNGPHHRPVYDAENNPTEGEATAFNLQDVREYQTLGRRIGLTAALIVALLIQPMTVAEFDQAEAALRAKLPYVHTSVIDMDAFEAALQPIRSETKEKP